MNKIEKVKLFIGFIFRDTDLLNTCLMIFKKKYGTIDTQSPIFDFNQTNYYEKEMGTNLKKQFVSFQSLIHREKIVSIKNYTNKIEQKFATQNKRTINIDPGYISLPNVSLATTKDYQHRIYVGKGIFLENTLRFRKGQYDDWEWTYPDFQTQNYKTYFLEVLEIYKKQLRGVL